MAKQEQITMAERNRLIAEKVLGLIRDTDTSVSASEARRRTKVARVIKCTTKHKTPLKTPNLESK